MARLTADDWAKVVLKYFKKLDMNADIYVKHPVSSIRVAAEKEQEQQHMGEQVEFVRAKRIMRIYPLKHIIKDVSAGSDLETRFTAFLKS